MFKTKLQDLVFVLLGFLPWPNVLYICAHPYLWECKGILCVIASWKDTTCFADFTIYGFQDTALSVRGEFRTLNSIGATSDYVDQNRLNAFLPQHGHELIMTRVTMQLIETKRLWIG